MGKIHIVTDSSCDISMEEAARKNIHIVPLSLHIDGKTYVDGVDISPEPFLDMMDQAKELPKSSQPAPGRFQEVYEQLGNVGDEIISIHVAGKLSGTLQSARQGAEMANANVTVFDSRFISTAMAIQVREAARLRDAGASVNEIIKRLELVRANTKMYIYLETLKNLLKGGRIGKGRALLGSLLNIKPIAVLEEGEYLPVSKMRSYGQVVKYMYKEFTKHTSGKTVKAVSISHAGGMDNVGTPLKHLIEQSGFDNIEVTFTSPIISTHAGRGAIALVFFAE
ncbi:MAG: DegV family protein [Bacilli bacterium]|nr:fatty acid-binding protein DegV [Bacilli bacterium]